MKLVTDLSAIDLRDSTRRGHFMLTVDSELASATYYPDGSVVTGLLDATPAQALDAIQVLRGAVMAWVGDPSNAWPERVPPPDLAREAPLVGPVEGAIRALHGVAPEKSLLLVPLAVGSLVAGRSAALKGDRRTGPAERIALAGGSVLIAPVEGSSSYVFALEK